MEALEDLTNDMTEPGQELDGFLDRIAPGRPMTEVVCDIQLGKIVLSPEDVAIYNDIERRMQEKLATKNHAKILAALSLKNAVPPHMVDTFKALGREGLVQLLTSQLESMPSLVEYARISFDIEAYLIQQIDEFLADNAN
jgi:hypothetical protein